MDWEAEVVAIAVKEATTRGDRVWDLEARSDGSKSDDEDYVGVDKDEDAPEVQPQTQGERMALESSITYVRHIRRRA